MRTRNILLAVLAGLLIVSMTTVLMVAAQEPTDTPPDATDEIDTSAGVGRCRRGLGARMGERWGGDSLIGIVAEALNVDVDEIRADLQDGKTLRKVIEERGGDPDAVVEAYADSQRAAITEWLDGGGLEKWANQRLDASMGMRGFRGNRMGGDSLVTTAADVLGVEASDLIADMQNGQTLREAIESRGGDPAAVVDAFVADRQDALDAMVDSGKITEEQAATMREHVEEQANERLDSSGAVGGMGPRGGMGGGRHLMERLGQDG